MKKLFTLIAITLPLTLGMFNTYAYEVGEAVKKGNETKTSPKQEFDPAYPELDWDTLIPESWDPMQAFKGLDLENLQDGDPRAMEALERMQKAWDQAPVNSQLAGKKVRIPGFVVPLEGSQKRVSEFLLVPYFGACIHTPPPPANQIIHIKLKKPVEMIGAMQPYWVWGELQTVRTESSMGNAGYRLNAKDLRPYEY